MLTHSYTTHRTPAGAVPDGVFVAIHISFDYDDSDDCDITGVNLIVTHDDGEPKYYAMNKNNKNGLDFDYSLEVSKGLYFYRFEFENQSTQKYQITVYDRDFKTPDLFKGGIM